MEYISRDQFNQIFRHKDDIEADDLVYVLEEHFDYYVSFKKKSELTDEQRQRMTDKIFSNENILEQLREASQNQDYITDDEEALKIIHEARDGQ